MEQQKETIANGSCEADSHAVKWGVCAVAIPRESYYWLHDWIDHHIQAGACKIVIYDNTGSEGSLRPDSNFQAGHLQRKRVSKRGEKYGELTKHLTDEDIQQEMQRIASLYGENQVEFVKWQPVDANGRIIHGQVEAYDDFIQYHRQDLDWGLFIDIDEYIYCKPGMSIPRALVQINQQEPDAAMIRMNAWRFECRWDNKGPKDITQFTRHRPFAWGGEKNFIRMKDALKADIHWYWKIARGSVRVNANPFDLAVCHYNTLPRELQETEERIRPRDFLKTPEKASSSIRFTYP